MARRDGAEVGNFRDIISDHTLENNFAFGVPHVDVTKLTESRSTAEHSRACAPTVLTSRCALTLRCAASASAWPHLGLWTMEGELLESMNKFGRPVSSVAPTAYASFCPTASKCTCAPAA